MTSILFLENQGDLLYSRFDDSHGNLFSCEGGVLDGLEIEDETRIEL